MALDLYKRKIYCYNTISSAVALSWVWLRCNSVKAGKRVSRTVEIPERSRMVQGFDGSCPNPSRSFGREARRDSAEISTAAPVIMGR